MRARSPGRTSSRASPIQPSGPGRLAGVQRRHRAAADGARHLRGAGAHPQPLRRRGGGLARRHRGRSRHQQAARPSRRPASSSSAPISTTSTPSASAPWRSRRSSRCWPPPALFGAAAAGAGALRGARRRAGRGARSSPGRRGGRYYLARKPRAAWAARAAITCSHLRPCLRARGHGALPGLCGADLLALLLARRALPRPLQAACAARRRRSPAAAARPLLPRRAGRAASAAPSCSYVAHLHALIVAVDQPRAAADRLRRRRLRPGDPAPSSTGRSGRAFAILFIVAGVLAWFFVLAQREPPRRRGGIRAARPTLLLQEIEAHRRTDAALQTRQGCRRGRQPRQEPLRRRPQPRVAHAAQRRARLCAAARARRRHAGRRGRAASRVIRRSRRAPVRPDRRAARHLEDRGGPAADPARRGAHGRVPRRPRRHVPPAGRAPRASTSASSGPTRLPAAVAHRREAAAADPHQPAVQRHQVHARRATSRSRSPTATRSRRSTVDDSGPGIAAERPRPHLRALRPRRRGAGSDAVPGLGLGLTITKLLAELMGGEIAV